ncbi:MAG: DNA polymerase III subunit beta [Planctomycetes bacterium]|nr:DNA polymerase III subunit beta [Planctomycetota bacterium]
MYKQAQDRKRRAGIRSHAIAEMGLQHEAQPMKIIVQTNALTEALGLVGSIVAGRTPKPVLQCVKLVAANGGLSLLATDLEVGCRYQLPQVEIAEEGEALIPAERLAAIVRESMEETLTISVQKETCTITGRGSRFTIYGYDPSEFPPISEFGDTPDAEVAAEVLTGMITKTLFATAKEHSRYAISGVLWEIADKKLQLVATDGRRLALGKGSLAAPAVREFSAIVPTKLMSLIQRVAGGTKQSLAIRVGETQMLIRSANAVLVGNLAQGNFPKYADVITKECTCKATLDTGLFLHHIRQAALLTNEESKGVRLSFTGDTLTLTSRAPETGEAEITASVEFEGEKLDIGFNPAYLTDVLKVVDTETIKFEFSAPNKPGLIRSGTDFLYVLMPVELG